MREGPHRVPRRAVRLMPGASARRGGPAPSPHRLCFFWAGVQWTLGALWWTAVQGGFLPAAQVPAGAVHALWFALGPMPLFVAGFLLTTGPKWLRSPEVDARTLRPGVAAFTLGWLAVPAGASLDARLAAAGLLLAAAGLALLVREVAATIRRGQRHDKTHPRLMAIALAAVATCLAGASAALAGSRPEWLAAIARAGFWWGPVAIFIVASHRMLPFFGDGAATWLDEHWPHWALWLLLSVPVLQGLFALDALVAAPGQEIQAIAALHLALAGAVGARLTLRWIGTPPLRSALPRMLFIALLWWLAALGLLAAASWPGLPAPIRARLAMAGLHALAIGYLGGTLLTMVTRVTATQAGESRAIDNAVTGLYAVLQAAAALRVLAALWPSSSHVAHVAAGTAWCLITSGWMLRYGPRLLISKAPKARRPQAKSP